MTEFIVVTLFVLLPLALLIPVLAQLIALRQDTETAARYAVWERTSWFRGEDDHTRRSDATIARQAEQRIYAAGEVAVVTTRSSDGYALDPFYKVNHAGGGVQNSLIAESGASNGTFLTVTSEESEPPGIAGAFSDMVKVYNKFNPGTDLNQKGLYESTLSLNVVDLSWLGEPFDQLGSLQYRRSNTLFTDAWNAGGPDDARKRASGFVPAKLMDQSVIAQMQSAAGVSGIAKELDDDSLIFGHVDVEPMPDHRLSVY